MYTDEMTARLCGTTVEQLRSPEAQQKARSFAAAVRAQAAGDIQAMNTLLGRTGLTVKFGGKTYPVESVEDAAKKWELFRDQSGGGVSEIGNGVTIRDAKSKIVAKVSYNGRVWPAKGAK